MLKKSAALANRELGQLVKEEVDLIARAALKVVDGRWGGESPGKMLGLLTAEQFGLWVLPQDMSHPLGGGL